VASGPNGAIPHHTPTGRAFAPGDMITIDCGARYGGYHADMTRTVALGPPAGWQRDLYALAAAAQQAGLGAAPPDAAAPAPRPGRTRRWGRWTRRPATSSRRRGTASTSRTAWATGWAWRSTKRRCSDAAGPVDLLTGFPSPSNRAFTCPAGAASGSRTPWWCA